MCIICCTADWSALTFLIPHIKQTEFHKVLKIIIVVLIVGFTIIIVCFIIRTSTFDVGFEFLNV